MGLHQVFSWAMSEKILTLLFLVGLPLIFRKIVLLLQPANSWWSLVIFPFTHYLFTYYGFFNFNLGIILLLWGIYYRIRHVHLTNKRLLWMFLLSGLLYFSHVFTCLCYFMFLGFYEAFQWLSHRNGSLLLSRGLKLLLIVAPSLSLCIIYFMNNPSVGENDRWTVEKLTNFYFAAEYLKLFNLDKHWYYNLLAWTLVTACLITIALRLRHVFAKAMNPASAALLLLFLSMTILAYVLPNTSGNAGYITYRFVYLSVLFMVLYLATIPLNPYLVWATACLCSLSYVFIQVENSRGQNTMYQEYAYMHEVSEHMADSSIVAPFFFNSYGFTGTFSAYLADEKKLILLDNYEASTNYFPTRWDTTKLPDHYFCDSMSMRFTPYFPHRHNAGHLASVLIPDYVVINGHDTSQVAYKQLLLDIKPAFSLIYSNNSVSLYKNNKPGPCKSL